MENIQKEKWFDKINFFERYKDISSTLVYGKRDCDDSSINVCIAIPTYRRPELLKKALESAVRQKFSNYEVIVVDNDEHTDSITDAMMKRYIHKYPMVSYYKNNINLGIAGNWNRCLELSGRKWTVILHDDDLLSKDYLRTVLPIAEKADCTLAGTFHYNYFRGVKENGNGYSERLSLAQKLFSKLRRGKAFVLKPGDLVRNIFPSPVGVLLRTEAAMELGGYDCRSSAEGILDAKFHYSHIYNGKAIIIPQILSYKGIGDNDFMRISMQKKIITDFYCYAKQYIKKYCDLKLIKVFVLDVTVAYQAYGIKEKYLTKRKQKVEIDDLLVCLGVKSGIVKMNKQILFLLTCLSMVDLIFRKNATTN